MAELETITPAQKAALIRAANLEMARRNFYHFCKLRAGDFYRDDRPHLKLFCDTLQEFYESDNQVLIINSPPRHGKQVTDDTPVLTTNGWKRHGDLVVGDYVFSPFGKPIMVEDVLPKLTDYHYVVEFSNGEKIQAHPNHEWVVYDRKSNSVKTLETCFMEDKLHERGVVGHRGHRYRFLLPKVEPIVGTHKNLPVEPYVLGAWLGDGSNTKPCICACPNDDIVLTECSKYYKPLTKHVHKDTGVYTQYYEHLREDLHKVGMCVWNKNTDKYIPDIYLTASIDQRLELLAGLLDTDGHLRKSEHRYIFTTSDEKLRDTFIELVSTFGWRTCVVEMQPKTSSSGVVGKRVYWQIGFNPTMFIPCRVERKQLREFSKARSVSITSITKMTEAVQGNCITVEGGVYLVGKRLVPTHNSRTSQLFVEWVLGKNPKEKIMTASYNELLATTFSKGVRNDIQEGKADKNKIVYRDIFPSVKIKHGDGASNLWSLEKGYNNYLATSPGGSATGFGASLLIIDDIVRSADEAYNETALENHWVWFQNTMLSRLEEGGKIIIVMTRWSTMDLAGRALDFYQEAGAKIVHVNLKALQDDGTMLCPDILSRETFDLKTRGMNRDIVLANYQQEPLNLKGCLFPHLNTYDKLPTDSDGNSLIHTIKAYVDTADKGDDFLCSIIYGIYDRQAYVLDVYYTKDAMEITEPELAKRLYTNSVNVADIESNNGGRGFGRSVEQILKRKYRSNKCTINMFHQSKNKKARILGNSTWVMQNVFMPVSWKVKWPDFAESVLSYQKEGKNAHDDSVDALAGICDKLGQGDIYSFE